jgi:hypothetical protein
MTGSVQHRHVGNNTTIEQEEENPTAYRGITHENSHLYTHKCNVHSHVYTRQCCCELTAAAAPSARPSLDVFPYFFPKANATIEEEEKETSESRLRVKRNIYRCCIHWRGQSVNEFWPKKKTADAHDHEMGIVSTFSRYLFVYIFNSALEMILADRKVYQVHCHHPG